jgi:hypothetical protein
MSRVQQNPVTPGGVIHEMGRRAWAAIDLVSERAQPGGTVPNVFVDGTVVSPTQNPSLTYMALTARGQFLGGEVSAASYNAPFKARQWRSCCWERPRGTAYPFPPRFRDDR